jgi:hypothetical protein
MTWDSDCLKERLQVHSFQSCEQKSKHEDQVEPEDWIMAGSLPTKQLHWSIGSHNQSMQSTTFWVIMLCSLVAVHWYFRGMYCLHLQSQRVSYLADFLPGLPYDPDDGVVCSSRTSVDFYWTTWSYKPEDHTLQLQPHFHFHSEIHLWKTKLVSCWIFCNKKIICNKLNMILNVKTRSSSLILYYLVLQEIIFQV